MNIIEIQGVTKSYGQLTAVDHIDLQIPKGIIYGMLGPNGAGKTSLIRMITQITRPDSGVVLLDGEPLREEHMKQIGYMPEERGLYKKMKVGDHLLYLARLRGMPVEQAREEIFHWFDRLQIEGWWSKKIKDLSKGMQQKIQFITTVLHRPKLIILDEPFSGLDPINANMIRDEIRRLVEEEGASVIFSTHRMEQVEEVCEQIVLINRGRKVLDGSVRDIKRQYRSDQYLFETESSIKDHLRDSPDVRQLSDHSFLYDADTYEHAASLLRQLIDQGVQLTKFEEKLPSINDVFIQLVQKTNDPNA